MSNLPPDRSPAAFDYSLNQDEDVINLGELFGTLYDSKWLILLIATATVLIGFTKTQLDRPIYKADGLLQVKENSASMAGLEPLTGLIEGKMAVMAEIELIKSRMILGKSIKSLHLDVMAKPKYFPMVGEAIARQFQNRNQDGSVSNALFGLTQYAWGGEAIQVETFIVPPILEDEEFILETDQEGFFKLFYKDEIILDGEVGKLANKQIEGYSQPIAIFVSLLKSRPETHFTIVRQSENQAIRQLKERISIAEKGKNTGMLELTVEAFQPDIAVSVLNEIANIYVQQNVDQKSAESQKTLEFLEKQLPILKDQLDAATTALNEYRTRKGSVDLNLEMQNILKNSVDLKTQTTILQQKRDELRQRFTESHPHIIATDKQIARLQGQISTQDKKIETLPETQQAILKLSRDVKVSTELFTTLLNNAQTLRIAKAGAIGNVRIIDYAILPDEPIRPRKVLIIGIALVLGIIFGIVAALIRKSLNRGIEDPDLIEKLLNTPVYATIPHSKLQKVLSNKLKRNQTSNGTSPTILALENKEDIAVESLRSLRTTLHFAFLEAQNNIIMITGPSPGIGKTFVSVNLAVVMADAGKKLLLIDGDMRRGYINKVLGVNRENGLSELIFESISLEKAIHPIENARFDFISTGAIPPNPSELLLHERFANLLDKLSKQYDLVIIDSPPILAVTDAAVIGRLAGATLMVIKAGQHPARELEQSTKRLVQAGVNLKGIVFNDLPELASRPGYGYGKYVYQYSYKSGK